MCPRSLPGRKEFVLEQLLCSGKLLEEGRGEEAAGKRVIPSRRKQAKVTLSGLVSSFSTVSGLIKPLQSEGCEQAWMRPFPWTSCSPGGMWSTQLLQPGARDISPSLAAHISSCPIQDTSAEWCDRSAPA